MEDYKLRDLRASHTLGWPWNLARALKNLSLLFLKSKTTVRTVGTKTIEKIII